MKGKLASCQERRLSVLLRNPVGRTMGMVLDGVRARAGNRAVLTVDPDHRQRCKDLIIFHMGRRRGPGAGSKEISVGL